MWEPTKENWDILHSWELDKNPFAAVGDYSNLKKELRWLNPQHREYWEDTILKRVGFIQESKTNFEDYYKILNRPIVRERWEFLIARKAWYIMPLGWEHFLEKSCQILDLGCGDGDSVQRIISYIHGHFKKNEITDRKIHMVGIDLNPSRIENANNLVKSLDKNITFEFHVGNITEKGLDYKDNNFDFAVCTAVLEALEDQPFNRFMDEFCRVTRKGIYVEDIADRFPGGYPRDNLDVHFKERGFTVNRHKLIFNQPFDVTKLRDPINTWPIQMVRNLWADKI